MKMLNRKVMTLALVSLSLAATAAEAAVERSTIAEQSAALRAARAKPRNAFQITATGGSLGPSIEGSARGNVDSAAAFNFRYEFQPRSLQGFGVVGLGPSLSVYPGVRSPREDRVGYMSAVGAGAGLRWQARIVPNQLIVPTLGYVGEWTQYRIANGSRDSFIAHGPQAGAWLQLSGIDTAAGDRIWDDYGIARSYVVVEWSHLRGSTSTLAMRGNSLQFGFRLEY